MELSRIRGQAPAPSNHLVQLMRQHPLLFFFLLAYGLSWAYELLVFGVLRVPFQLFTFLPLTLVGPTMAAFLMTAVTQGRAGIVQLLRRYVLWRVGIRWYLFVLLGIPAVFLLPALIQPGALSAFRLPGLSVGTTYLITYLATLVLAGPLMEEGGWRGFALPRMEQRSGPLVGTLLLGVLSGLWYLPLMLLVPSYLGTSTDFVGALISLGGEVIGVTALSFVYTWVFNNTRGSILLAMLLHASWDTGDTPTGLRSLLFPSLKMTASFGPSLLLLLMVVAGVIIAATRGRLSYQRYLRETALPAPLTDREQEQEEVRMSV
jgi:membrane protease YdiL (CAAX protease family)